MMVDVAAAFRPAGVVGEPHAYVVGVNIRMSSIGLTKLPITLVEPTRTIESRRQRLLVPTAHGSLMIETVSQWGSVRA